MSKRKKAPMDAVQQAEAAAVAALEVDDALKVRTDWAGSFQPMRVEHDRARHSPANHPVPARDGQLASGHLLSESVIGSPDSGSTLDYQVRHAAPSDQVTVQWGGGPVASALAQHVSGKATVSELDQHNASMPGLAGQLGDRAPMGIGGAPRTMPEGTAGNMPSQQAGAAPRPEVPPMPGSHIDANTRPWGDRDLPRATHPAPEVRPPGAEYTSMIPGEWRGMGRR